MSIKYKGGLPASAGPDPLPMAKKPLAKSAYSAHLGQGTLTIKGQDGTPIDLGHLSDFSLDLGEKVSPPSVGAVTVAKKDVLLKDEQTQFPTKPMEKAQICTVNVGGSQTVNLGNYESAKISVSLTVPCLQGEIDDAYEFASSWVSGKIEETIKAAKKGTG